MLVPQVNALTVKWLTVEQLWRQQTHVPEQASERWPKVAQQGFILLTVVLPNLSSNSVVEISYKLTVNEFQREHRSELSSTVVSHETDASSSPTVEKRSYSLVPNDYHRNASLKQIMS